MAAAFLFRPKWRRFGVRGGVLLVSLSFQCELRLLDPVVADMFPISSDFSVNLQNYSSTFEVCFYKQTHK
jgi:hypothetical protein